MKWTYEFGSIFLSIKKSFVQGVKLWKKGLLVSIAAIVVGVKDNVVISKFYESLHVLICQLRTMMLKLLS